MAGHPLGVDRRRGDGVQRPRRPGRRLPGHLTRAGQHPRSSSTCGGLRLRDSDLADVPLEPTGIAGIFPPNGSWSCTELHAGSGASQHLSTVLGTGFLAGADDEGALGCSPEEVQALREDLTVTSMTVGELAALEALAADGALLVPNPG